MVWLPIQWYQSATIKRYGQYNAEGLTAEQQHDGLLTANFTAKIHRWRISKVRKGCSQVAPTEWKSSGASEPLPSPPHSSLQRSQGWCSQPPVQKLRRSAGSRSPPFVTFPLLFLDTECVASPHTQFLLPCLPKMTPALPEVPFHSFFHGRTPTATCKCRQPHVTAWEVARHWYR